MRLRLSQLSTKLKLKLKLSLAKIRGDVQKKPSIFKDIAHIGGGEVNPISKNGKEIIF